MGWTLRSRRPHARGDVLEAASKPPHKARHGLGVQAVPGVLLALGYLLPVQIGLGHLDDYLPVGDMQLSDELRRACDELVPPGGMKANFHNSAGWGAQSRTLGVADRG